MILEIEPSKPVGSVLVPPSKSHTLRAILFSALAFGQSEIENPLNSPDTEAMLDAVEAFGATVYRGASIKIEGHPLRIPERPIDCGNSGLVFRFMVALASLLPGTTFFTGDHSIRTSRVITPLLHALEKLGARTTPWPHLSVTGPISPGFTSLDGADSQPVSALLIAASLLPGTTHIQVDQPGETPWIDMTLHYLASRVQKQDYTHYRVFGAPFLPRRYQIPADSSSALFPWALGLHLEQFQIDPIQGDGRVMQIPIQGSLDVNPFIDALPLLAVLGCRQGLHLKGGAIARKKESDRIHAIATELRKMGADLDEAPDGLLIRPSLLSGAHLFSHSDHRIALSLIVAALQATSPSRLEGVEVIQKTYPTFIQELIRCGAKLRLIRI
jgi:3-phosphoshikimate 1-carboxyvinyltransferase